ncbi:MAG: hypothetical protein V4605_09550 [Pseudomonadota bacterium]
MALDTYANLQTSIINFAHRADLNALIPDFIRLAEDKIYATLESKRQDLRSTLATVANQENVSLPSDYMDIRSLSISLNNETGTLDYYPPDQYETQYPDDFTGMPKVYTIVNTSIYLKPIPDAVYSLTLIYTASLTALSTGNPTNWLLTKYPSIYLHASLEQLAMYIKDTNAAAAYEAEWQGILDGINIKDWNDSASMRVRTDVNLTRLPI